MNLRILSCALLLLCAVPVSAQTTVNPDISAVGDFRVFTHDDAARPDQQEEFNFADPFLELFITGYLNPYMSATAVVGWHEGHNAEIEELYASVHRGLPLNLAATVGRHRLPFGRLNPVHPHAYSFLRTPLPHEVFFGEEGLSDVALQASVYLPTGQAYTELYGSVLKGDALSGHGHEHEEEAHAEEEEHDGARTDVGFFGRLTTSFAPGEYSELALGASAINSVYEMHEHTEGELEQLRAWVVGGDVKYRWVPSRYTTLQIEAEGLMRVQEAHEGEDDLTSYGGYGYLDYRFRQRYNIGGIFEWLSVEEHVDTPGGEIVESFDTMRYGLFVGFAPVEETAVVRLVGHYTDPDETDSFWELTAQLVISLGPHKAHNF